MIVGVCFRRRIKRGVSQKRPATLIAQLDVPVGKIDKVLPEVVLRCGKGNLDKRAPLWPFWFANEAHMRFPREPIALARIAGDARANDVFPTRVPAAISRNHVIKIQIAAIKNMPAILAGALVALEHVVASKLHFLFREPIEKKQDNHTRHADPPRDGRDHFVFRRGRRKIAPTLKIVRHEIVGSIGRHDMGVPCIDQCEGASRRADVHRLPQAVQHQNLTV